MAELYDEIPGQEPLPGVQWADFTAPESPESISTLESPQIREALRDAQEEEEDKELRARLGSLRDRNRSKYQALLTLGAMPEPGGILNLRINTLLELLFDERQKLRYDVLFETRMSRLLDTCLGEARQASLRADRQNNGGLIVP